MPYEKLLKEGRIRAHENGPQEVRQLLGLAERDFNTARLTLEIDADWADSIAYNGALQAARALMFSQGYRPRGAEGHLTVVRFAREALGQGYRRQVDLLDQMRRKRNRSTYEFAGLIGEREAGEALKFAEAFLAQIREFLEMP